MSNDQPSTHKPPAKGAAPQPRKVHDCQDGYLADLRKSKKKVSVYLINGIKLQGFIESYDTFSLQLSGHQSSQLVYKHAIASIQPFSLTAQTPNTSTFANHPTKRA